MCRTYTSTLREIICMMGLRRIFAKSVLQEPNQEVSVSGSGSVTAIVIDVDVMLPSTTVLYVFRLCR